MDNCPLSQVSNEAHRQGDYPRSMTPCELYEATPLGGVDIPALKRVLAEHHRTFLSISRIFTNGLSIRDYPYYSFCVPLHMLIRTAIRHPEEVTRVRVHEDMLYVNFGERLYLAADIN